MPYRKQQFDNGDICHIILRGIDGKIIFKDTGDYFRGIFSIYEFNNLKPVSILKRRQEIQKTKELQRQAERRGPPSSGRGRASSKLSFEILDERDKLVEVLAFCFMPNHIHLLIRQLKDDGITKFMSKIGTGYGRYFNKKYERKGYLFQNRFLAVKINNNTQLEIVFNYIHTNPLSLFDKNWGIGNIENLEKSLDFLEDFKWSSFQDCIGKKNFPSVIEKDFMLEILGGEKGCRKSVSEWVESKKDYLNQDFENLFLE